MNRATLSKGTRLDTNGETNHMSTDTKTELAPPAYAPYATLISSLDGLKKNGIPSTGKIDKTLFDNYAGSVRTQLLGAYRFFGLTDANNLVQPKLPELVNADQEGRKRLLKGLIEQKYARIIGLDLSTISQGQLDEAFRGFDISGSTLVRAERFFIKACVELGIPISKRISEKGSKNATTPRAPKSRGRASSSAKLHEKADHINGKPSHRSLTWEDRLLQKFPAFDPKWPDELKAKWFEGFERFMAARKES